MIGFGIGISKTGQIDSFYLKKTGVTLILFNILVSTCCNNNDAEEMDSFSVGIARSVYDDPS